ncbi:MAG: MFS transporter [Oliverpabstia sp.]
MTYATYIGNSNFGILVGVTGIIITASRIFDGITDPICAYIIERFNCRFGKIRVFMIAGWAVMALATTAMCNWGAGHLSGLPGLLFFIVCYMLYIIGYTLEGISSSMMGPIMTNDPKQRPTLSVWSTIYSYFAPMVIMIIFMVGVLPKYNSEISTPSLAAMNICTVVISLIFFLLACIGITPYDKQENFVGVSLDKKNQEQPSLKDMWALIKDNKELQRYMVAACSDKLAQTVGSASVISTMLYGIMIGNLSLSTTISTVAMLPSIIFAIVGAKIAGKQGNKKVMVDWTWICMILNILFAAFLLFTDTTRITVAFLPTAIFFLLQFANNATRMVVSTATNALRMDIVDYELYRSGKYMPASVSATYSFVDKFISSFGATIATLMIGLIGYTTTTPQQGDPLTLGVRVMTVLLLCGFPIIGWVCTIVSMKKSELTREKMVEVQKTIADKKTVASEMK